MSTELAKYTVGVVTATVVAHEVRRANDAFTVRNVEVSRAYRDRDGREQRTTALRAGDVPAAILVLLRAYEFVLGAGVSAESAATSLVDAAEVRTP